MLHLNCTQNVFKAASLGAGVRGWKSAVVPEAKAVPKANVEPIYHPSHFQQIASSVESRIPMC
jgi:hypothetical protein